MHSPRLQARVNTLDRIDPAYLQYDTNCDFVSCALIADPARS